MIDPTIPIISSKEAKALITIQQAGRVLDETPERYKRERIYQTLDLLFAHPSAPRGFEDAVAMMRAARGDTATHEIRQCACSQKNRVNLMSTHDNGIGPRCGRCGASLEGAPVVP